MPSNIENIDFILIDVKPELCLAWQGAFDRHPYTRVKIQQTLLSDLLHNRIDCIVSPANSYGLMDGGFDHYISKALSPASDYFRLTRACQAVLYEKWRGYAPPGTCTLVSLPLDLAQANSYGCRYIAICPTMRTPEDVTWDKEVVYNCMWSLLVALDAHNAGKVEGDRIARVLMTGFGTGIGKVSPERCAEQMALAFAHFSNACADPEKWAAIDWDHAEKNADEVAETRDL